MISRLRLTTVAALLFATCGSDAFSAFFDPLFRITKIQGPVSVMRPGDAESVPAVEGQAYPYGTRVVVGKAHPKAKEDPYSIHKFITGLLSREECISFHYN